VDGVIGDPEAPVYFYHTDHLGSVRVVTDLAGEVVWNADYFAFGTQYGKNSSDFEEGHGFTGKEYDPDTGLYYFNARWYDSELGRFISEDPIQDEYIRKLSDSYKGTIQRKRREELYNNNQSQEIDMQTFIIKELYKNGLNQYLYCRNNSLNYLDPNGYKAYGIISDHLVIYF
jgi:RHS repeat-associated protein